MENFTTRYCFCFHLCVNAVVHPRMDLRILESAAEASVCNFVFPHNTAADFIQKAEVVVSVKRVTGRSVFSSRCDRFGRMLDPLGLSNREQIIRSSVDLGATDIETLQERHGNLPNKNAEKNRSALNKKEKGKEPITLLDILKEQKASKYSGGIYHKTQIDLTYNSNHMEGSRLTHDQTRYIFETNTIGVEKEVLNVDDVIETANHFRMYPHIINKNLTATDFIRKFLIITNSKPIFSGIAGAILQNQVKFFDEFLRQSCFCMINNHVDTTKVICRFNHIIHIQHFFFYANSIGFKDISGLIMCQTASFHMVGVVCQINLCLMVYSTGIFTCLLLFQNIQQRIIGSSFLLLISFCFSAFSGRFHVFLKRLDIGGTLNTTELPMICSLLEVAKRVKAYDRSDRNDEKTDSLSPLFSQIQPLSPLLDEIRRCVVGEDEIADDASAALSKIRKSIRDMNNRIHAQMEAETISSLKSSPLNIYFPMKNTDNQTNHQRNQKQRCRRDQNGINCISCNIKNCTL